MKFLLLTLLVASAFADDGSYEFEDSYFRGSNFDDDSSEETDTLPARAVGPSSSIWYSAQGYRDGSYESFDDDDDDFRWTPAVATYTAPKVTHAVAPVTTYAAAAPVTTYAASSFVRKYDDDDDDDDFVYRVPVAAAQPIVHSFASNPVTTYSAPTIQKSFTYAAQPVVQKSFAVAAHPVAHTQRVYAAQPVVHAQRVHAVKPVVHTQNVHSYAVAPTTYKAASWVPSYYSGNYVRPVSTFRRYSSW